MKIVIISGFTPRDRIILDEIFKNFENVTLIRLTFPKGGGRNKYGTWLESQGKKVLRKIHKIRLSKMLKPGLSEDLVYEIIDFPGRKLNSREGHTLVEKLEPDILFTCGAPILKESLIRIPKLTAINTHFGISPHYRGNDTLFWALFKKDFNNVGGCLHYLTKGVDTGNILAEVRPQLEKGDGELSLEIKIARLLAIASANVLQGFLNKENLPKGKNQTEKGKNYKSSERTLFLDTRFLTFKSLGLWRVHPAKERVDYFI